MIQEIVLGLLLLTAMIYLGRFFYRQVKDGGNESHCDKCLPKESLKEKE